MSDCTDGKWLDTHYHFDFIQKDEVRFGFLESLWKNRNKIVAQTVLPSEFVKLKNWLAEHDSPTLSSLLPSLGFHPWWIQTADQVEKELQIFAQNCTTTSYIGEIGLDFSQNGLNKSDKNLQLHALRQILTLITTHNFSHRPVILSIHSVHAASCILDLLEEITGLEKKIVPIFHRYNDPSDALTRLMRMGGYISLHPNMFLSKKGRAYIHQVPVNRLLLESDLPQASNSFVLTEEMPQNGEHFYQILNETMINTLSTVSEILGRNTTEVILKTHQKLFLDEE